ncbi:MAG TPA: TetR/AcrR family transcriptional regulator [Solirubrobacteraceae bacterium]|jgi:AcrR family transcriptional regulator
MTEVAVQEGYAAASVARVIARAGVSRPTFYEYFTDREDCFLSTHRALASDLLDRVRLTVREGEARRAVQGAVTAIVDLASSEPDTARFLMQEAMAAGAGARDERDRTIATIAAIVEDARAEAPPDTPTPDLSVSALVGGVYRLLSVRLRRGERDLEQLLGDLERWLETYEQPTREHRWRTPKEAAARQPIGAPDPSEPIWLAPPPLPRSRSGVSDGEISQNQRERIMFAAVQIAYEQGYAKTTIADITATARLDRRVFYQHFRDKQEAFLCALEKAVQQAIAVAASGFFSAPAWPDRVWEAGNALTRFLANNIVLTHVGFIESYAIGPGALRRFEDLRTAFTIFLQEGYQHQRDMTAPASAPSMEAIAATIFEIAYQETRRGHAAEMPRQLPNVAHLCLAPFIGAEASNRFIDVKTGVKAS